MKGYARTRIAALALIGVLAAAGLGYLVQSTVGERVALQGASRDANFKLSPDGEAAKKAMQGAEQSDRSEIEIGPDGNIIEGANSLGDPEYHTNNAGAARWDD